MINIIKYVTCCSDETFFDRPMCDADALVFCQIAYFNFNLICEQFVYTNRPKRYKLIDLLSTSISDDLLVYRTLMGKNLIKLINPLKKSNIGLLIDGLYEACQLKNVKIVVALVMALNTFAGGERSMREEIRELK